MKKCQGIFGYIFGHNYKPCYDETETPAPDKINLPYYCWPSDIPKIVEGLKAKSWVYRGHVCTRCGDKINEQNS